MRTVGKRTGPGGGDREALDALVLRYGGGAPKGGWDELLPYRARIAGVNVISLAGLLRMKENGRPKDRADAEEIRKVLQARAP